MILRLWLAVALGFFIFTEGVAQCGCTDCRCADSLELVSLYNSTNGAGWTVRNENGTRSPWVLSQPMTSWYGITLTNGRVTCIDLDGNPICTIGGDRGNNLVGSIPNLYLSNLQYLSFSNNLLLSGNIPNFNLPNLKYLLFNNNSLNGSIPNFNLPNLQQLGLIANNLTGNIPNFDLPNLERVDITDNRLSGSIPNFNLPKLQYLSLFSNQLNGNVPNFNLPKLRYLALAWNQLSGNIPNFSLPNLQELYLFSNQLSGCIPKEIKLNCPQIGAANGGIASNPNLATQSWANYWNNNEGACPPQDTTSCRYKDSLQLVNICRTTGGASWANRWDFSQPITSWYGVRTNAEGCVTFIDLDGIADFSTAGSVGATGNNLSGQLPTLNFSELLYLFLDNNQLSGSLPHLNTPKIKNLAISYNPLLRGAIPTTWNLPDLEYLAVCCNGLDGSLPSLSFPKLIGIYVQNNQLKGNLPNLNLPLIQQLDFGQNQFSNCFPASYRSLCPISFRNFDRNPLLPNNGDFNAFCANSTGSCSGCRYLDSLVLVKFFSAVNMQNCTRRTVVENGITRTLPWDLNAPMSTWYGVYFDPQGCVAQIGLANSNLTGSLPTELGQLSSLNFLNLPNNSIGGTIPTSLGNLTNLTHFNLSFNRNLGGSIPTSLGNLIKMQYFYLGGCSLTGDIPTTLGNMTEVIEFGVNDNRLSGTIPTELGKLRKAKQINLDRNLLRGGIPTSFGNLDSIKTLTLYTNQLTGTITTSLTNLKNLQTLLLSDNQLTGTVPNFRTLTQLNWLGLRKNRLDSLPNLSNLPLIEKIELDSNRFTFDDVLPMIRNNTTYAPQDSFFVDTTIATSANAPLNIDLKIDPSVGNSIWRWFKNGQFWKTETGLNQLIFNNLQTTNAGVYTVQVINPNAPQLTLQSRKITLIITGQICTSSKTVKRDSFCDGSIYTFPDRSTTDLAGNYRKIGRGVNGCPDTTDFLLSYKNPRVRNLNATFCDSFRLPSGRFVKIAGPYRDSVNCDSVFIVKLTKRTDCDSILNQKKGACFTFNTAVTPNNDGINDVLELRHITDIEQFKDNSLEIINRWGQVLYKTENYQRNWAGQGQSGQELPSGAYWYILKMNLTEGKCHFGLVELYR